MKDKHKLYKMQTNCTILTQPERIKERLIALNAVITEKDRKDFLNACHYSRATLSNYMNGKINNLDIAMKMLLFFRKKVDAREQILNETAA